MAAEAVMVGADGTMMVCGLMAAAGTGGVVMGTVNDLS